MATMSLQGQECQPRRNSALPACGDTRPMRRSARHWYLIVAERFSNAGAGASQVARPTSSVPLQP
jgi:hypothetical protein